MATGEIDSRNGRGMKMALDELPGHSVLDSTGRVIGKVERAMVDMESWAVESLRVRLRRDAAAELGLPSTPFRSPTLDVPTGLVLAASDAVILRATLEDLHGLAPATQEAPVEAPAHH
jgi:sporulation protein YlmC with PRC-barrel domain